MVALPTPLNITCSCPECTIFLRPIPNRSPVKAAQHFNPFVTEHNPNSSWTSHPSWPSPPSYSPKRSRTRATSWVDKLSLSAEPGRATTSPSSTSSPSSSSSMEFSTPSPKPDLNPNPPNSKTKLLLRLKCSSEGCEAQILASSTQSLLGSALCGAHAEELRDCVGEIVWANWQGKSAMPSGRKVSSEEERKR